MDQLYRYSDNVCIQNALRDRDREALQTKSRKYSVNNLNVDELLLSLNSDYAIGNTDDWRLTSVSKNVREICKVFGLGPPKSAQIILG